MNKYRLKVSEAGLGWYHGFKLWPEAHNVSGYQQKLLNLFEFLITHGKEVEPVEINPPKGKPTFYAGIILSVFNAYSRVRNVPSALAIETLDINSSSLKFLIKAGMLTLEEVT